MFLIGLWWGSGTYPWSSAHCIATIVVGGVTLIAFVGYGSSYSTAVSCPTWLTKIDAYVHQGGPLLSTHLFVFL